MTKYLYFRFVQKFVRVYEYVKLLRQIYWKSGESCRFFLKTPPCNSWGILIFAHAQRWLLFSLANELVVAYMEMWKPSFKFGEARPKMYETANGGKSSRMRSGHY